MAAKSKKSSAARKPAAPSVGKSPAAKPDPKELDREINNALFTDEERAGIFFAQHWKKLLIAALVAVVAITAVFAIVRHRETVRKEASARLAGAKTIAELEAALAANSKVPGVDAARFRLAKLYADKQDFDKARQELKIIADTSDDAANRGQAKLNIAYLLEFDPKVNKEDAAKEFAVIADLAEDSLAIRAEAAYAAARLYVDLKQPDNAKLLLDKIMMQLGDRTVSRSAAYWYNRLAELKVSIN